MKIEQKNCKDKQKKDIKETWTVHTSSICNVGAQFENVNASKVGNKNTLLQARLGRNYTTAWSCPGRQEPPLVALGFSKKN